jgi:hypothetical protein
MLREAASRAAPASCSSVASSAIDPERARDGAGQLQGLVGAALLARGAAALPGPDQPGRTSAADWMRPAGGMALRLALGQRQAAGVGKHRAQAKGRSIIASFRRSWPMS